MTFGTLWTDVSCPESGGINYGDADKSALYDVKGYTETSAGDYW